MDVEKKKCNKCLKIKNLTEFKQRKNGNYNKRCIECNKEHLEYLEKSRCEHNYLNKSACKQCNGNSICEHNKYRTYCQICGGGSLCEHGDRKDRCSKCRTGSQFCEHDTLRTLCKLCEGGSFCEHNTRRTRCMFCNFKGYLKYIVSSRVNKALKKSKDKSSIEYLGCDIDTFKKHIENLFVEGMSWDNYGKEWHIDHIIPIAYDNPDIDEVITRLNYKNTQPLWAKDNISKNNRYIG